MQVRKEHFANSDPDPKPGWIRILENNSNPGSKILVVQQKTKPPKILRI